jgi:hypothetical protein
LAVIGKDDQMGLLSIDGFDDFIQTVFDSIVKLRLFDDLGKGGVDVKFFLFLFFRHFNNNTFNLPGLFLGVFGGAVVGEYLIAKKSLEDALKVGGGSILGFLAGTLIKLMLGIIMVGVFVSKIWF